MRRILVADDHPLVRRYVRDLLESEGCQVCGEATTGRQAVEMAAILKPDLVVLDLSMPELNGLDAARQILATMPETKALILTMHESEDLMLEVLASGVSAFVVKTHIQHLVDAVHDLLQPKPPRAPEIAAGSQQAQPRGGADKAIDQLHDSLTDREREIVQLVAQSRSNREIAAVLAVSLASVEAHRTAIMRKLQINSIVDLVRYGLRIKQW